MHPAGAELFHTNRKTDRKAGSHDEANSRFANALKSALTFHSPVRVICEYLNKKPKQNMGS
jgi:hypothetical protein